MDEVLRRDGMTLMTGTTPPRPPVPRAVSRSSCRTARLLGERLLVATRRRPDLRSLGADAAGIDPDAPSIETDCHLCAGDGVWAVGM
jgi:pyruvate/2-oxoglutarate dehydrogenase complex dihydrolipoamide dehydrogenase (E3) component